MIVSQLKRCLIGQLWEIVAGIVSQRYLVGQQVELVAVIVSHLKDFLLSELIVSKLKDC